MSTVKSFEDLEIWQMSRAFCVRVFEAINAGDFQKDYKLRDQLNGSSGSTMDNIAEGFERDGKNEFIAFLSYAKGSIGESRSQLYRARDRNYLTDADFTSLRGDAEAISKKISRLISYLKKSTVPGLKYRT